MTIGHFLNNRLLFLLFFLIENIILSQKKIGSLVSITASQT